MCLYVLTSCVFENATAWRVGFCPFSEQVPPPSTNFLQATRFFFQPGGQNVGMFVREYIGIYLWGVHTMYIYICQYIYTYLYYNCDILYM